MILIFNKSWGTHTWQMTSEDWSRWLTMILNLKTKADWIDYWNHIHHCHWSNLRQFHRLDCEFWAAKIQFHPEIEKTIFNFYSWNQFHKYFRENDWYFFSFLVYLLHIFFDDHSHNNQPYENDVNWLLEVSNLQPYL